MAFYFPISVSILPLVPEDNTKYTFETMTIYYNGCIWWNFRKSSISVDESVFLQRRIFYILYLFLVDLTTLSLIQTTHHRRLYRVIHKSVKHFKNSQQIAYSTDHGSS